MDKEARRDVPSFLYHLAGAGSVSYSRKWILLALILFKPERVQFIRRQSLIRFAYDEVEWDELRMI